MLFCNRLVDWMNKRRALYVSLADVEAVRQSLLEGPNSLPPQKFDNLITSGPDSDSEALAPHTQAVLKAIACTSESGWASRESLEGSGLHKLDTILDELVDREVLDRWEGRHYEIRVKLFRDWLVRHG